MIRTLTFSILAILASFGTSLFAQSKVVEFDSPKMKVFLPPKNTENGKTIVACPGEGYHALVDNQAPVAMFIYPEEGHGRGYRVNFKQREQMLQELSARLKIR